MKQQWKARKTVSYYEKKVSDEMSEWKWKLDKTVW